MSMDTFLKVDKKLLSAKHQQVAKVVEKKGVKIAYMSIEDIAREAHVSTATISRFWRIAGFRSFKHFKEYVKKRIETTPENKLRNSMLDIGSNDLFDQIIEQNYEYLFQTHAQLNQNDLKHAAKEIIKARRVIVHAPSSSEGLGSLLIHRLKRFGISVERTAKSGHEIYESMIHFEKEDCLVIFQYVKLLPESKALLDYARNLGMTTVLFTDQLTADVKQLANYILYAYRGDTWNFHSMVAPISVVETVVMLVGLNLEDRSLKNLEKLSKLREEYSTIVSS